MTARHGSPQARSRAPQATQARRQAALLRLSTGIAANPLLRFFFVAAESGDVEFWWEDDERVEGVAKARLVVA